MSNPVAPATGPTYAPKVPRKTKQPWWPDSKRKRPPFRMTVDKNVFAALNIEAEKQGKDRSKLVEQYILAGLRADGVQVELSTDEDEEKEEK